MNTHTLTRHRDIQNWVNDRQGRPAIARVRNMMGQQQSELRLRFDHDRAPQIEPDDGMSPCSWTAWLAELDRQQLALRVDTAGDCELVARSTLN
jgi:hypothetical protein